MAGITFEGLLDNLNEAHIKFVQEVLEKRGIINGKVVVEPVGKKGDNYVACVLRLTVESNNGDVFKMIAKVAPQHPVAREMMNIPLVFRNEHVMYTEVLPKLTEQQIVADVPKIERLKLTTLYGSTSDAPNEIIILEDLRESNFIIFDRMQSLSNDSVKLVIKDLARLHSLSYVLKHKNSATYNNLKQKITNPWTKIFQHEKTKEFYFQLEEDIIKITDDEKRKTAIKNSVSNMAEFVIKFNEFDLESEFSVIQQGDCWINNIMFRLENDKPVECIMIDYQLAKVASPVQDILHFILNCTDYESRSKYFYEWINCYHVTLVDHLTYFGLDAKYIYPREQLDADLKRHGRLELSVALLAATVFVRESKDAFDFSADEDFLSGDMDKAGDKFRLSHMNKETLSRFQKKVEGLVDSVTEFGLI